jgi:glycerophosphoryl diester phosphodiesterase
VNATQDSTTAGVDLGERTWFLADKLWLGDSSLEEDAFTKDVRQELHCMMAKDNCHGPFSPGASAIAYRGSSLDHPDHTEQGYLAAIRMGAGSIHCEAVFNKDGDLYCRSDVCDLAYTTDILTNPDHQCLADKCTKPFQEGIGAECCATDFTSEELGLLCATSEMEKKLTQAVSVDQYLSLPSWKQDKTIAKVCPRVLKHADFISLAVDNNVTMVSELLDRNYSAAGITSKEEAARVFIKEYQDMAIEASHVHPQSTSQEHVETWLTETVYANAVIRFDESALDADIEETVQVLASLSAPVKFVAVHWNKLVTVDGKYESTQISLRFIEKEMNIFALALITASFSKK